MLTDDRLVPLSRLRVAERGQGRPYVVQHNYVWEAILKEERRAGTYSIDANGQDLLEYIEDVGLVCRGRVVLKDTRLSQFSTGAGSWEEERPATGTPRVYRLVQYNTAAGVQYVATSTYQVAANPSIAFSFILPDSPPDWNNTSFPAYAEVEFGLGWRARFTKDYGAQMLRLVAGTWVGWGPIKEPTGGGYGDVDEFLCIVRCHRGLVLVSTDFGKTFDVFHNLDNSPITVAQAPITFRGQGGVGVFGVHQVLYTTGTWTSPQRGTIEPYSGSPAIAANASQRLLPDTTSIGFTNLSGSGFAQFRATLTPSTDTGTPFNFSFSPELYAATLAYPTLTLGGSGFFHEPFEVHHAHISKPFELDQSTVTITCNKDHLVPFIRTDGQAPIMEFLAGHETTAGLILEKGRFFGYADLTTVSSHAWNDSTVTFTLQNVSYAFKRARWVKTNRPILGNQTINAAILQIGATEGFGPEEFLLHSLGNSVVLDWGAPEDPFAWPKDGETKWETMQWLAGLIGLEIVPTDPGGFVTIPKQYVDPFISYVWSLDPADGEPLQALIQGIDYTLDANNSATAVMVSGESPFGEQLVRAAIHKAAETTPARPDFCPFRVWETEEMPGTCTAGMLTLRAQALAGDLFPMKFEPAMETTVNLDVLRRWRAMISASSVGIASSDQFVVLTVEHDYYADPAFGMKTQIGLQRVG